MNDICQIEYFIDVFVKFGQVENFFVKKSKKRQGMKLVTEGIKVFNQYISVNHTTN